MRLAYSWYVRDVIDASPILTPPVKLQLSRNSLLLDVRKVAPSYGLLMLNAMVSKLRRVEDKPRKCAMNKGGGKGQLSN